MRAIVLSGGGARGAYEAGVWKALRRLNISYDIVTGTSIGALNGLLMVQKEYHKCINLWKNMDFSYIYDNFTTSKNKKDIYLDYIDKMMNGGVNTSKIEKLIDKFYKPKKLYASPILFGVVAFNLTTKRAVYATKANTKPDQLKDYIMASATCFPVFQIKKINQDSFIDGGYYDNLPVNLAIELGADEIIAVDLGSFGFQKRIKTKDVKITYIEPTQKLDSFLMFEKNATKRMMTMGYNDTMKVFRKKEGKLYTFKKGSLSNIYARYYEKWKRTIREYEPDFDMVERWKNNQEYRFYKFLEETMEMMEIDITKVYNSRTTVEEILTSLRKTESIQIKSFDIEQIKKLWDRRAITKYIYDKASRKERINPMLVKIFNKEFAIALFCITIGRKER